MQNYVMPPSLDDETEQKIMASVVGQQALNSMKAPKVSQADLKAAMGDDSGVPQTTPVPGQMAAKVQAEKDKSYQAIIKDYMKKREDLARNSQDRAKILGENFEQRVDLTPLMALSDNLFGGNMTQSYNAPQTQAQNFQQQQAMENQANQTYGALTDDQMNLLRQELLGKQYDNQVTLQKQKMLMKAAQNNGGKPLPAESIKRLDYIIDGSAALDRIKMAVESGQTMRPDVPFVADNDFTAALRDAAEQYGRMQSGGAISRPEEERFIKAVWKMGDSPSQVLKKLEKQKDMFEGRRQRLLSGGRGQSAAPKKKSSGKMSFEDWKKSKGL